MPFELSPEDVRQRALQKYQSRYIFGAQTQFLDLKTPHAEFIPFYLCNGRVKATYTGTVSYSRTSGNKNGSQTEWVTTGLLSVSTTFHPNKTQLYGGYKYNNRYIHHALRHEANAMKMKKISEVDVSLGQIGLFETSTHTMRTLLDDDVKKQVTEVAEKTVRQFHPAASTVQIKFQSFDVIVDDVYPTFLPAYIIKAEYDGEEYTLYASGSEGTVGGPFLINALLVGRMAALATFGLNMLLMPNKVLALATGSVAGVAAYLAAFHVAKRFPAWRRDYFRQQREAQRKAQGADNDAGFRPSAASQRVTEEYHRSSYWDTHKYQQRADAEDASSAAAGAPPLRRDPKGYYEVLGVARGASVNDIRSAYRQHVLMDHPDAGGSNDKMIKLNEAYRTLRDPKLRDAYDRS